MIYFLIMKDLLTVDWATIPAPIDDGAADHLVDTQMPEIIINATDGNMVNLSALKGLTVIYAYPRTGRPGVPSLSPDWDIIPGARGCTPQACAFRDHYKELTELGVDNLFGLSTQDSEYQREVVERLHLPFPLLSEERLALSNALKLPTFEINGVTLLKRFSLIIQNGLIRQVFYPVFPPDRSVAGIIKWLKNRHGNLIA